MGLDDFQLGLSRSCGRPFCPLKRQPAARKDRKPLSLVSGLLVAFNLFRCTRSLRHMFHVSGFKYLVSGFKFQVSGSLMTQVSTSENAEYTEGGSLGTSLVIILWPRIARITRIGSFGTGLGLNSKSTYRSYNTYGLVWGRARL